MRSARKQCEIALIIRTVTPHYALKYMNTKIYQKGFTLVELIIVIAIIAILASAIFVAIDPARRLHEARNARRSSDIAEILDGVKKYQADNAGTHYIAIANLVSGAYYQIGNSVGSCEISCASTTTQPSCVDLTGMGTNYLATIPVDPKDGTQADTKYALKKDLNGAITVASCEPEGGGPGGADVAPVISVTR